MEKSILGRAVCYATDYDPGLLFAVARAPKRIQLGIEEEILPFDGVDIWNAYEISWLNPQGLPQVAVGEFRVPAASAYLIESKSLKLYLNSFNQTVFATSAAVAACISEDLSRVAGATVNVQLLHPDSVIGARLQEPEGILLDTLPVRINTYHPPRPDLLRCNSAQVGEYTLRSYLLKSNCLVTGQPDWASVQIRYCGGWIEPEGLLQYLVSFRQHQEFHEQCVERIFMDIWTRCQPQTLLVQARYTRRGGLDINPCRSSQPLSVWSNQRGVRQ